MTRQHPFAFRLTAASLLIAGFTAPASADGDRQAAEYEVTVTNLTKGQILSPPVIATHTRDAEFFVAGEAANEELVEVAENGNGQPLANLLNGQGQVFEAKATMQGVGPGGHETFVIDSRGRFDRLSLASMLVNTNDAFAAIDSVRLPTARGGRLTYYAIAYDAGSEANNENCDYIPGPACPGSPNLRDAAQAEGFVHVHSGVHGNVELPAEQYDWRNPVAKVVVTRVR